MRGVDSPDTLAVNKVAGNFISRGKSFDSNGRHVHDLAPFQGLERSTFARLILHKVSFGRISRAW